MYRLKEPLLLGKIPANQKLMVVCAVFCLEAWNIAGLGKMLWQICSLMEKLWVLWIHSCYNRGGFWRAELPTQAAWLILKLFKIRVSYRLHSLVSMRRDMSFAKYSNILEMGLNVITLGFCGPLWHYRAYLLSLAGLAYDTTYK